MRKNKNLCVVIPVHKPGLTAEEQISLNACKAHLDTYDCYLVFPAGMDITAYTALFNKLVLMSVDPAWLSSVEQYNKMKINLGFYQLFDKYSHMLTYELDAYIFNSDIENTNALEFDYIGAPFFEGYWAATPVSGFMKGCNSGFSLRNIQSCITVLKQMKRYRFHWILYKLLLSHTSSLRLKINDLTKRKYEVFVTGKFAFHFADFHLNEDVVWSEIVPQLFPSFVVADSMSALNFSFEYNLEKSLKLNGNKLPLGCHAWAKHPDFWKSHIDMEG